MNSFLNSSLFRKLFPLLILTVSLFALLSCGSSIGAVDFTGLWSGTIESNSYDARGETVVFEFLDNGKFRMGDPDNNAIESTTRNEEFNFSASDYYIDIEKNAYLYYMQFYFLYSDVEDTIEIILIQRNFYNDAYDILNPGDRILLMRNTESDFYTLLNE